MHSIIRFDGKNNFVMVCDFCARQSGNEVTLIQSPNASHICLECVDECKEVADEQRAEKEASDG